MNKENEFEKAATQEMAEALLEISRNPGLNGSWERLQLAYLRGLLQGSSHKGISAARCTAIFKALEKSKEEHFIRGVN